MTPYVHRETRRIVMGEVDAAHIHFTTFQHWMDRGFGEILAGIGYPMSKVLSDGPGVPIVESRCRYLKRVLLDDVITMTSALAEVGNTSFRSKHAFTRDGELVADGELVHVCLDRQTRETLRVPQWLRDAAVPVWPIPNA
jgi:YbgC/YbaW family acyl-CoA thioester hydrolase